MRIELCASQVMAGVALGLATPALYILCHKELHVHSKQTVTFEFFWTNYAYDFATPGKTIITMSSN